jgi:hypothetical protein
LNHGIHFAPLLPWPLIAALAAAAAVLVVIVLVHRGRGWTLRAFALAILVAALANPSISREEREPQPDLAVVVVDESASMAIASRGGQAEAALAFVETELGRFDDLETRVVRANTDEDGTRLFAHLERALADEPAERLAGIIMITDGQVHDVPDTVAAASTLKAPLHVLLTGEPGERDRRMVIEQSPAYGLVGDAARVAFRVEDGGPEDGSLEDGGARGTDGAADRAVVEIRVNGEEAGSMTAPVGQTVFYDVVLGHAGASVIELEASAAPDEISTVNNRAVLSINGVRERLRVLLISGQPHPGERAWRNLLKSDPSVDLVHFTILRPPDKDDFAPIHELSLIAFPVQELFEEQLNKFDLIVFDRFVVGSVIPWHYLDRTAQFLEGGGAILLDAGPEFAGISSLYRTPLGRVMPVAPTGRVIEQAFRAEVSDVGRRHPVTSSLPGETVAGDGDESDEGDGRPQWGQWFRLIETESVRGDVLMQGPDGRPLLIVDRLGEGRIAGLMSDHIWLWARGYDGGGPHNELMRRLVHWLMKEPELEEERLTASVEGGRLTIERRSLATEAVEVSIVAPDGSEQTVTLPPGDDGIARGEVAAPDIGLYRVKDGHHTALAASGPINPQEFRDLRATPEHLEKVVEASGGGIAWLGQELPEFRRTAPGRETAGRQWMGLCRNGHAIVTGIDEMALFSPYMILGLALAGFAAAWWREGR